jgi:hypothetical protein
VAAAWWFVPLVLLALRPLTVVAAMETSSTAI